MRERENSAIVISPSVSHPPLPLDASTAPPNNSDPNSSTHAESQSSPSHRPMAALGSTLRIPADGKMKMYQSSTAMTTEEAEMSDKAAARFAARLAADHLAVLCPDVDSPFSNAADVVNRLLPYHVYQHPKEDLDALVNTGTGKRKGKGKEKASHGDDIQDEIAATKFALHCLKRQHALQHRFRRARVKSGTRASPDDQSYVLAQTVLETERSATTLLSSELCTARSELEKLERKRAPSVPQRQAYYPSQAAGTLQPQFYRPYAFTYAHPYAAGVAQPGSTSIGSYPVSLIPTYTPPSGSIPVQLPVTSLPALAKIGIVPVPAASLMSSDQPQPPAVLQGTTANGTMLSLRINVSLLQPGQMNGLASLLSTLMKGGSAEASSSSGGGSANPSSSSSHLPNA